MLHSTVISDSGKDIFSVRAINSWNAHCRRSCVDQRVQKQSRQVFILDGYGRIKVTVIKPINAALVKDL